MDINKIYKSIEMELTDGRDSREREKEGRARVCARRAAGLALGIYYEKSIGKSPPKSAYKLLQWFSEREEISQDLRDSANRLTVRVTPAFRLPHDEDPLEDAQIIIDAILGGSV